MRKGMAPPNAVTKRLTLLIAMAMLLLLWSQFSYQQPKLRAPASPKLQQQQPLNPPPQLPAGAWGNVDPGVPAGEIVFAVMTCQKFEETRCRAQRQTWLQQVRHVKFYTDSHSHSLDGPTTAHTSPTAPHENKFRDGAWRALPMLKDAIDTYFPGQRRPAEGAPKWVLLLDDDSYVFVANLQRFLHRYNPAEDHYLGYVFYAAPHLEGIIPGRRQPFFANGGAGILLSYAALYKVYPLLEKCWTDYAWDWPGDIRIAQCMQDAQVKVVWEHTLHPENPESLLKEKRITLPALSFHHVMPEGLHALHTMQRVYHDNIFWDWSADAMQEIEMQEVGGRWWKLVFGYAVHSRGNSGSYYEHANLLRSFSPVWSGNKVNGFKQVYEGEQCAHSAMAARAVHVTIQCQQTQMEPQMLAAESADPCIAQLQLRLQCPPPQPRFRLGLDMSAAGAAKSEVVRDGQVAGAWGWACEASSSCNVVATSQDRLVLHLQVASSGSADLSLPQVQVQPSIATVAVGAGTSLHVHQGAAASLVLDHTCLADGRVTVKMVVEVVDHWPLHLAWTKLCSV